MTRRVPAGRGAAVLGVLIGTSLILLSYGLYPPQPSPYPVPPPGWTTFGTAEAAVQSAIVPDTSGPWALVFSEGAAANGPWSPMAWQMGPITYALCDVNSSDLVGKSALTFWNPSAYPFSNSPTALTSGGAPLWTFVFENMSGIRIVGTWWIGRVLLNGVVYPTSPDCVGPPYLPAVPGHMINSNAAARAAWTQGGSQLLATPGYHSVLYFASGQTLLGSFVGGGGSQPPWSVAYTSCGDPGVYSQTNVTVLQVNSTTGQQYGEWSESATCFDTEYFLWGTSSQNWSSTAPAGHFYVWSGFAFDFLTSAVPAVYTRSSLTTNLFRPSLQVGSVTGPTVARSASLCGPGSIDLGNCSPPSAGWYAVILGPSGDWLDSYPSSTNASTWTVASVPFLPEDQLVIVTSSAVTARSPTAVILGGNQLNPFVFSGLSV